MKRILNYFIVCLLVLSLSGCMKHNVSMEVKKDKSVTLEMIYEVALDKSFTEGSTSNSTVNEDDYKFLKELGYNVEMYENEKDNQQVTGVKITKKFDNIDDITTNKKDKVNLVSIFNEEKKDEVKNLKLFYKDKGEYVSNFEFNYQDSSTNNGVDVSNYQSMFNLEYKIKLPNEASRNNATNVSEDKTEYTWKLDFSKNNDIDFAFKFGNSSNMIYIVLGAIAVLAIVIIVVVLVSKSKKKNNNQPLNNNVVNNSDLNNPMANNQNFNSNPNLNSTMANNQTSNSTTYNPNLNSTMANNQNTNNNPAYNQTNNMPNNNMPYNSNVNNTPSQNNNINS